MEKTKQQQKKLEDKDAKKAKVKQAAYDADMTKTAQSLAAQLRDVAWAFCAEVWSETLNIAQVDAAFDLREVDKVHYPPVPCVVASITPSPPNPSSTSSAPNSTTTATTMPAPRKDKEHPTLSSIVELESEDVAEVEQLKKKKKGNEKEVTV